MLFLAFVMVTVVYALVLLRVDTATSARNMRRALIVADSFRNYGIGCEVNTRAQAATLVSSWSAL